MQVSTSTFFRNQTDSLQELKTSISTLQTEIASGKKVTVPSDDPIAFSELSRLKAKNAELVQAGKNIISVQQRLAMTENALTQFTTTITRIKELGVQAGQSTASASDKMNIAAEISVLSETLLGLANTKNLDGTSLFAGYKPDVTPFTMATDGTVTYHGDSSQIEQTIGSDASMHTNLAGSAVFLEVQQDDGSKKSIFDTIKTAMSQLKAGEAPTDLAAETESAITHIGSFLTITGARLSRVTDQVDRNQQDTLAATAQISTLEGTDVEKAITEMKQKMLSLDAAQASFVKIADLSLFSYLR